MLLICSRGHSFDTTHPFNRYLRPGDRCPMLMRYDRIGGSTYCRRVLRESTTRGSSNLTKEAMHPRGHEEEAQIGEDRIPVHPLRRGEAKALHAALPQQPQ